MEAEEWPMAEILSIRTIDGGVNQYYVHFVDYNKRLDEWVNEDRLDTRKGHLISECLLGVIDFPKKPTKNLTNFCPESKNWSNHKIKAL